MLEYIIKTSVARNAVIKRKGANAPNLFIVVLYPVINYQ